MAFLPVMVLSVIGSGIWTPMYLSFFPSLHSCTTALPVELDPAKKSKSDLDVELDDNTEDKQYIKTPPLPHSYNFISLVGNLFLKF